MKAEQTAMMMLSVSKGYIFYFTLYIHGNYIATVLCFNTNHKKKYCRSILRPVSNPSNYYKICGCHENYVYKYERTVLACTSINTPTSKPFESERIPT